MTLSEVRRSFIRKTCIQHHKLVIISLRSPGLSWDAMLKMTVIKLELIIDIDMFQIIQKGMVEYLT